MSERGSGSGRYARISPIPGRGSKIAYIPCPLKDVMEMDMEMDMDMNVNADADIDIDMNADIATKLRGKNGLAISISSLPIVTVKKYSNNNATSHVAFNKKDGGGSSGGGVGHSSSGALGSGGKTIGSGGIGGSKSQTKGIRMKRSRELGGGSQGDEIHYRTHLFFAPARPGYDGSGEERCSGFTTLPIKSMTHETDAPQPLVDRRPSLSLLRWNNYNDPDNYNHNNTTIVYESNLNGKPSSSSSSSSPCNPMKFSSQLQSQAQSTSYQGYNFSLQQIHENAATTVTKSIRTATTTATTSLSKEQNMTNSGSVPTARLTRTEPISLAALDRDCFIIPVHSVERFLPAGIPMPPPAVTASTSKTSSSLSVLEVSDPKMCILVHLMSPLEPIDPMLESPLAHPLLKQRNVASELLNEVQQMNQAIGGMLLANMEKSSEFPFIAYYAINTTQTDPSTFYSGIRVSSLSKFEPKNLKYTAAHTLDLYSEVAAICRPPLVLAPSEVGGFKKTQTPATGYIISVFKVFEGDDGERFEKNWLYWTGARMLYRYLPRTAGLRRIALHKSTSKKGDKMYLLVCECADLLKDITAAAFLIPALRARLCGYTGLYRPIQAF